MELVYLYIVVILYNIYINAIPAVYGTFRVGSATCSAYTAHYSTLS